MSAQSAIYNPSQTTSAATGDGFSVPRLTTTGRLAITFTTADKGMMVYDTTLDNLFIWNGAAWESVPASGDAGANGSVQYNDNGVVSGAANFFWDKTNNRVGIGTASPLNALHVLGSTTGNVGRIVGGGSGQPLFLYSDNSGSGVNNGSNGSYGTGLYFSNASNFLAFYTDTGSGGTEKARIDSTGNVGIGVTPSAWGGSYKALQLLSVARSIAATGAGVGDLTVAFNAIYDSTDSRWEYAGTGDKAGRYSQTGSGNHRWFVSNTAGTAGNEITDFASPAMTLDASGNLLVGTTGTVVSSDSRFRVSATAVPAVDAKTTAATQAVVDEWNSDTSGDNLFNRFWTESSPIAFRGSISYNRAGGLVAYNTTSDYRAKDIIGPVSNSGSLIDSLKVYVGKMKGATIERPMLIAHEAQAVAPYAVTGTKDEVDADGNPKYQQMDVSALVPLLIAEIQSLRARVQTLEAK
jgi:hypothetical protein